MPSPGIVFLMYHELELSGRPISQSEPGYVRYVVPESSFRAQINWLAQNGWRGLSVGEALAWPPGKSVALTFDDGCETDLITAAPILKERGFTATFYVTAGFIGTRGYLSPEQLRNLFGLGFEIGCHSMTHAYLDDLDEPSLRREIFDARKKIEDLIGGKVEHFSCPGGRYNRRTSELAREAGYCSLATSETYANGSRTHRYSLGRVAIMRNTDLPTFARVCSASGLWRLRAAQSARGAIRNVLGNSLYDRVRGRFLERPR